MTDDPYFEEDRMFGYMVACARCGATGNSEIFYLEEEDEWECPDCWKRGNARKADVLIGELSR